MEVISYAVNNASYPGSCGVPQQWAVVNDSNLGYAVTGKLASALQFGTPLLLSLEQAIQACDRHVYIADQPPNPLPFIYDFLNVVRWEVSQLWDNASVTGSLGRSASPALTPEHYKRSGELLAEGLAISLLSRRLNIPPQKFFFYSGLDARPDFLINLKRRYSRAVLNGGSRWALEVRFRHNVSSRNLSAEEQTNLDSKKSGKFSNALAVYVMWGDGSHRDGTPKTRIHIADPVADGATALTTTEEAEPAIHYYLNLVSQLGLWEHREHLTAAARNAKANRLPETPPLIFSRSQIRSGEELQILGKAYRGRILNSVVYESGFRPGSLLEKHIMRQRAWSGFEAGDFGVNTFRGLSANVLALIEANDWAGLTSYHGHEISEENLFLRQDGLVEQRVRVDPNSPLADQVRNTIPRP